MITGGGSGRVSTEGMWGVRRVVQRRVEDAAWGLEWGEGRLLGNASGTGRSSCRYDKRTYQVLITIRRLTGVQVKSRGYKNAITTPHEAAVFGMRISV